MAFKSGKNGRLSLNNGGGATAYKIKRWSVTPKNQIQDVTNGESGGYGQYIAGVSDLDFSCDLDHDVGTNPFGTHFIPGLAITGIFYVDGVAAPNWSINGIVEDVSHSLDVRGLVTISLRGRATSLSGTAWTAPST
jgi:hypothetical protein